MAQPVVHFEIIGKNHEKLQGYVGELFGWEFDTGSPDCGDGVAANELRVYER
jgi:predicted enzyme related to lactoylglutathione lyase